MIALSPLRDPDPYATLRRLNPKALVCSTYSDAYLGFTVGKRPVATYDYDCCIRIVVGEGDLTEEEATVYFYYFTISKCLGKRHAPLFIRVSE